MLPSEPPRPSKSAIRLADRRPAIDTADALQRDGMRQSQRQADPVKGMSGIESLYA